MRSDLAQNFFKVEPRCFPVAPRREAFQFQALEKTRLDLRNQNYPARAHGLADSSLA